MVVDTTVFAYSLLRVAGRHETATTVLERAPEIWVPDSFFSELANVVRQWVKARHAKLEEAVEVLSDARRLVTDRPRPPPSGSRRSASRWIATIPSTTRSSSRSRSRSTSRW